MNAGLSNADSEALLSARGVTKSFGGIHANRSISLELNRGEQLGLIGPNGSGKTTFLNVIAGFHGLDSGEVLFQGKPIHGLRPYKICRRGVSRTFQNLRLFYAMSVLENVLVGSLVHAHLSDSTVKRAMSILEMVGLDDKAHHLAATLSTGQRKRLELARGLASEPTLLLLDEPLAGVDPGNREPIVALLQKLCESDWTMVIVEHDMQAIQSLCSRVLALHQGAVIADGAPAEVLFDEQVRASYLEISHA